MNDLVERLNFERLRMMGSENFVPRLLEEAAQEIERLQNSINNCSTEEGLCYANELARKDKEIERLQKYEDYVERGIPTLRARTVVYNSGHPSLCWHCSKEEGFYDSPCKYCGAINPNVDFEGANKQQEAWNAC